MDIYSMITTVLSVLLIVNRWKWKKTAKIMLAFCKDKFRAPTDEEIETYTRQSFHKLSK